jgi:hypothetical protein
MRLPSTATYTLVDLFPYLPLNEYGTMAPCPVGGIYTCGVTVENAITCNIVGHVLDYYWAIGF